MRQIPHKRPPFYSVSTKRVSYKLFSLAPLADTLQEQDLVRSKESIIYSGTEEVKGNQTENPGEELRAAKSRSYWTTGGAPDKRADYKGCIEVGRGEGRNTREIELIWWPELFPSTNHGKLSLRFFIKKVSI